MAKINLSMQYYTFQLDDYSKELCTITTPFGLYHYEHLPMGLKVSPDIAQNIMEQVLQNIPGVEVYIDDIAIFSVDWSQHLNTICLVLQYL